MKCKLHLLLLLLLLSVTAYAQKITVKGYITNASDILPGVAISEKNTTNGTYTDFDGSYYIKVAANATLVFSYLGYESQEVLVNNQSTINVSLKEFKSQLDELVILGFDDGIGQARRRTEAIQNLPESVVAYNEKAIEAKGIQNLQTFTDYIPNVNFTSSLGIGNNFLTVRGISHIRNGESPVAFVVDGVTLPDANLINQELFDISLIEIVKGPQGALYGKNAIAGAINILTNKPTNTFKHHVSFGYSSGQLFKTQFSTSGPLVKDKLFYRISASGKKGDGVIDNETLDRPVDFIEEGIVRAQIKANLSEKTNLALTGQYLNSEGGGSYFASPIVDETPIATPGINNAAPDSFENYAITADELGGSSLEGTYANAKLTFNLDNVKVVSSTTYNKSDRNNFGDFDYTVVPQLTLDQDSDSDTFNQEIKVSSVATDSRISWDVGAFYQDSDKRLFTQVNAFSLADGVFLPFATGDFTNTFKTFAAFGFLDIKATDRFTISLGLRYDNDDVSQENIALTEKQERTDSELQPKLSLAYKASDNVLLYANYGRGYRNGGFNQAEIGVIEVDYEAELTNNFEFGIKNSFWKDRLILNASGFYIDFENQQQFKLIVGGAETNGSVINGIINFDESESYGFEVDLRIRPSKYFDILAGYGLSKSVINEGTSRYSRSGQDFDVAGNNTPFVPQDSYILGLESNFDLTKRTEFNGNILLKQTGEIFWHEDNLDVSSAYSLLNAKLGLTFNNNFSLSVWGNNILDQDYITEFFGDAFSNGGKDVVWKGNPVTAGINLGYKF